VALYDLTVTGTLDFLQKANTIASDGLFMIITLIIFVVLLFYSLSRVDLGRSLAIASFISIIISILFVALNLMSANLLMLLTVLLIAGILLSSRGGAGYI